MSDAKTFGLAVIGCRKEKGCTFLQAVEEVRRLDPEGYKAWIAADAPLPEMGSAPANSPMMQSFAREREGSPAAQQPTATGFIRRAVRYSQSQHCSFVQAVKDLREKYPADYAKAEAAGEV